MRRVLVSLACLHILSSYCCLDSAGGQGGEPYLALAGARLVQSGSSLPQNHIPGLNIASNQGYAKTYGLQNGLQHANRLQQPVAQLKSSAPMKVKQLTSPHPTISQGRRQGQSLLDGQAGENPIPGLGLPVQRPREPIKDVALPKASLTYPLCIY